MPFRIFRAYSDRVQQRRIQRRNQAAREDWQRQIAATKARERGER